MTAPEPPLLLVGRWAASSPEHQRAAIEAACDGWGAVGVPDGMTAFRGLAADDGVGVLTLSWWRDEQALRRFTGEAKSRWWAGVDRAVPGLDRRGVRAYRRHGGLAVGPGEAGCLVLVDIAADDAASATAWMDGMLAVGATEQAAPGMLAATFYLDVTGTGGLNLAEWTSAAAHDAMRAAPRSPAARSLVEDDPAARPAGYTRGTTWRDADVTRA